MVTLLSGGIWVLDDEANRIDFVLLEFPVEISKCSGEAAKAGQTGDKIPGEFESSDVEVQ
jgi:hypothetical protein